MGIEWLAAASLRMTVAVGNYGGVLVFEAFEQNVIDLFADFGMLLASGAAAICDSCHPHSDAVSGARHESGRP
jgi:hypothetical protein